MEFTHKGEQYRLERGVGTGGWLLLHNFTDHRSWRLIAHYPQSISDSEIINYVKDNLDNEPE